MPPNAFGGAEGAQNIFPALAAGLAPESRPVAAPSLPGGQQLRKPGSPICTILILSQSSNCRAYFGAGGRIRTGDSQGN